jgi:lipopolysaccharide transport system permease protein
VPEGERSPLVPVDVELRTDPLPAALVEAWRHRHVAAGLIAQNLTTRVPRSILGVWWVPITLVFQTLAMGFVFGTVLAVSSAPGIPYLLFITVGTAAWLVFYRGTLYTMRSFHRYRHSVSFSFPLVLLPIAAVTQLAIELVFIVPFVLVMFLVFLGVDGELYLNVSPELLLAPVGVLWLVLFAVGMGLLTGPIYWRARDVRNVLRLALPFWLFITPIVYPLSSLSGGVKTLAAINPLTAPVELIKRGLLDSGDLPLYSVAASIGITVALLAVGLWFTNRYALRLLLSTSDDGGDLDEDPT